MNRFCLLLLAIVAFQIQVQAQVCVPDPGLADAPPALYPLPFNADTRPTGGISEAACAGMPYEFVFTLIAADSIDLFGTVRKVNNIILNGVVLINPEGTEVSLGSVGLSYNCSPGSCNVAGGSSGCLVVRGNVNANVTPGKYELVLRGTTSIEGLGTLEVSLPDQTNFPGDVYILEIRDESCTPLDCDLRATVNIDAATCFTSSDGSATVNTTDATGEVTYQWSENANSQTTATATDLARGTYQVTVTDGSNCTVELEAVVGAGLGAIEFTINKDSDASCSGGGQATVIVTTGTAPYTFAWSDDLSQSDSIATDLAAGEYTVTVTGRSGCTNTGSVVIEGSDDNFEAEVTKTDITCAGEDDGTATASVVGGNEGASFSWSNIANDTTSMITGLAAGTYTVTVTKDACEVIQSIDILEGGSVSATLQSTSSDCNGGNNGTATVTASGGSGNYSYAWSGGIMANTAAVSGLAPGDYEVTVSDEAGCSTIESFTIGGADQGASFSINLMTNDISCNGAMDGSASLTIEGEGELTGVIVEWSNGEMDNDIANLAAGNYDVTVTAAGCTLVESFEITEPTAIEPNISTTNISCDFNVLGGLEANPTGGSGGYTYSWSSGPTSNVLTGVGAGEYILTVTDSEGCEAIDTANIVVEQLELMTTVEVQNVSCNGDSTGSATVNVLGGDAGLTFEWSSNENTNSITNKTAGEYMLTITNAEGCEYTETVVIEEALAISLVIEQETGGTDCNAGLPLSLTANANGGTGMFTYEWSTGSLTATISELQSATYIVTVTDANNCTAVESIDISTDGNAFFVDATVSPITCNGDADGSIQLLAQGGSGSYTYEWSIGTVGNSSLATGLPAGTYMVTITDEGSCSEILSFPIEDPAPIRFEVTMQQVSCGGGSDGGFTLAPIGGTPPYSYDWVHDVADTNTFSNLIAGNYAFVLTDANGCGLMDSVLVSEPEPIEIDTRFIGGGCSGQLPTAVESMVTGGDGNYTYSWSNGSSLPTLNTPPEGSYVLVVEDGSGCIDSVQVVVDTREISLELSVEKTNVDCNDEDGNGGSATVNVRGGSGNYNYEWSNNLGTTATITDLSGGTYTVTVMDDTGCEDTISVEILNPGPFGLGLSVNNLTCFGAQNGSILLQTQRGTRDDFIYSWSDGPNISSRTGLSGGMFTVTVTELATGCVQMETVNVTEPDSIRIQLVALNNVSCAGENDGSIRILANGGAGGLTYLWSTGSSDSLMIDNLSAGEESLTVTDRNNCRKRVTYTITEPESIEVAVAVVDQILLGDGEAVATVTGGTPPYSYEWIYLDGGSSNVGSNNASVNSLSGGRHLLNVTDANGCMEGIQFSVGTSSDCIGAVNLDVTTTPANCDNILGSISVVASGGNLPYTYIWDIESVTDSSTTTIDSLSGGTYNVTVFDSRGCPSNASGVVSNPADFGITISSTPVSCAGLGALRAVPGGQGPFQYFWDTPNRDTTQRAENLPVGTYTVEVVNGAGCSKTVTGRVMQGGPEGDLEAEITSRTSVSCPGDTDGATSIEATGGEGPYTFNWSLVDADGAEIDTFTGDSLTNLAPGTYLVTVTDDNDCEVATSVEIVAPDSLQAEVLVNSVVCATDSTASAGVNVTGGGTAPFTYLWSTGDSTQGVFGLAPGLGGLTITDSRGCSSAYEFEITAPDPIVITEVEVINESQPGADDGEAEVAVTGGNSPYRYLWENGDTTPRTTSGLSPGIITVTVTDANECEETFDVAINDSGCALKVDLSRENVSCNGAQDGSVSATLDDDTGDVTYDWGEIGSTQTIENLGPGSYTVMVTDETGCSVSETVSVTEPAAILVQINSIVNLNCDGSGGEATAIAEGGMGTLSFLWSSGEETARADDLVAGTNTVTVTDANGCTEIETVDIIEDSGLELDIITTDVACNGEANGSVTVNISGANSDDFSFDFEEGVTSDGNTASDLAAGDYMVTVTDMDGCSKPEMFTIEEGEALEALATVTSPIVCRGDSNAVVTIEVQGGSPNYSYIWEDDVDESERVNVPAGSYTINITDENGCTTQATVTVTQPDEALTVTIQSTNETELDADDGQARVEVSGGTGNYRYEWNDVNNSETETVRNLAPGDYEVTVTDDNGCTIVESVTIEGAEDACAVYAIEINSSAASCPTSTDGRAEVTGISNSEERIFTYEWSSMDSTAVAENLMPGVYTVTITDDLGCPGIESVTIFASDSLALSADVNGVGCEDSADGQALINVEGGLAPYIYTLGTDTLSENRIDTLDIGSYTVTVTDANGCGSTVSFDIEIGEDNTPPSISARELTLYLDEFGEASFEMMDLVESITDNCSLDTMTISATRFNCDNVGQNDVIIRASDSNGNLAELTALVMVLDTLAPFLDCLNQDTLITDCAADRTIAFDLPQVLDNCGASLMPVLVSGLESGDVFPPGVTEQTFEVMDSSGNVASCTFIVDINVLGVAIQANEPNCFGFANGSLTASPINANGDVFYNWDNNDERTATIEGLSAGIYTVTVVDDSGCSRVEEFTLTEPDLLVVDVDSVIRASGDEANGSIFVSIEGGSQPYNYQWYQDVGNGGGLILDVEDLVNIEAGEYRLTVFDANGCTVVTDIIMTPTNDVFATYEINLQPNPTSGQILFELEQENTKDYELSLYDMTGRLMKKWAASKQTQQQLDLSELQSGVYLLRVQVGNDVLTKRIIVGR